MTERADRLVVAAAREGRREEGRLRPSAAGSLVILAGALAAMVLPGGDSYAIANQAALLLGAALGLSLLLDLQRGVRNLMRVDLLMLAALYGLLFLEFLFPQPGFAWQLRSEWALEAVTACAVGFMGIALGRLLPFRRGLLAKSSRFELPPRALIVALFACAFLGYLHMLLAVGFDPFRLVEAMMGPRFTQPWTRGRFGGLGDLLNEVGLLIYLIPPAVGVILAQRRRFGPVALTAACALLAFTLFHGFSTGTRNIFAAYVLSFLGGYVMARPRLAVGRTLLLTAGAAGVLFLASETMLDFRRQGLASYIETGGRQLHHDKIESFFVDYNLLTLGRVVASFPERFDYLGLEVPYWALVKPVPRALWPGKPTGLSVSLEEARYERGARAATWSSTFVGEAYMAGGMLAVFLAGLFFGALAAWWNTLLQRDATLYQKLLYASGFFAAAISMRSLFWYTTAILPTLALYFYPMLAGLRRR